MSLLITLIIFSILIIVHEFGHFIAARRSGVRVEKFAIGFGPVILRKKFKETDFLVCAFPLGGYVKMAGDNRQEKKGLADEFLSKPAGTKIKIVFAGPLFNYLLALVIFWIIAFMGFPYQDAIVGEVLKGYPAEASGFEIGDKILQINGKKVSTWDQMRKIIRRSSGSVSMMIERGESVKSVVVPLRREEITDDFGREKPVSAVGILPFQEPVIGAVIEGYPAKEAGLEKGDIILKVSGKKIKSWAQAAEIIHKTSGQVVLEISRSGNKKQFKVATRTERIKSSFGNKEQISVIGISPLVSIKLIKYGVPEAFIKGTEALLDLTSRVIKGFWYMITGSISFKEGAAGPIGIFYITSESVKYGILAVLQLMAALNISLAVINLFPIPILDGGHIAVFLTEKIRGKPLSEKAENILSRAGLVIIGSLVVFVLYNDTIKYGPQIGKKIFKNNNSTTITK
ncbi:MAG: RIP metalloprotease RseP [Candidatus Omnitrophica bacterium]|nr:RIP metalloprotease RseP [Candidatus Omnitrophota bacterium]MDD5430250.1 RIP metalloprotease RseP [Candidatus Omnitrophota bacterium]